MTHPTLDATQIRNIIDTLNAASATIANLILATGKPPQKDQIVMNARLMTARQALEVTLRMSHP